MSSFLVNCAPTYHNHHGTLMQHHQGMVVDPAFPPTEEYNQNNYITPDFFSNHHYQSHHQYDGYFRQTPSIENSYINHNQITVSSHTSPSINYGNYVPSTSNAYQLPQHLPPTPHHPTPQEMTSVTSISPCHYKDKNSHSGDGSVESEVPPSTNAYQLPQHIPPTLHHSTQPDMTSVSPCEYKEKNSRSGEHSAESEQEDLDDDEYSHGGLTDPIASPGMINERTDSPEKIIYPWMKKVHVAGYGKFKYNLIMSITCITRTNNKFIEKFCLSSRMFSNMFANYIMHLHSRMCYCTLL